MVNFNNEFLRKLREEKGWSRRDMMLELYKAGLDVSETTLSNWEFGESEPDVSSLASIAKLFKVKLENFISSEI